MARRTIPNWQYSETKGFDEYWGWLYHLNAMEYTSNPDFPQGEEGQAFRPRNIIDCVVTADGKQQIRDDGPCPPERMKTLDDEVTKRTLDFIERQSNANKQLMNEYYTTT